MLLRLPNWVGDVVMAASTVAALHEALPESVLVAQAKPGLLGLAALLPGVSATLPAGEDRGPGSLRASRRALKAEAFDAAVVFPRGIRAMLAPWLARIPVRVGFGGSGHGLLLTHPVEGWKPWRRAHRSAFFGLLGRPFGVQPEGVWRCRPSEAARAEADRFLRGIGRRRDRPLVVLEPGAAYGPAKCWPADRFGRLAQGLLAEGVDVCTVGTRETLPLEDVVEAHAGAGLLRAAGLTPDLEALAALLAEADLVVANDTGPMHVAAAVGAPVLALFGATDPVVSAPTGPGPRRLLWEPEPCSPCFLRRCPVPGHPCLERFGVEQVLAEARALLPAGSKG